MFAVGADELVGRRGVLARLCRDRAALPMYRFTRQLAALRPGGAAERLLFTALADRPTDVERFVGVLAGVPAATVFSLPRLVRLVGTRRFLRMVKAS